MSGRAVFLDRDGVLNRVLVRDGLPSSPRAPEELEVLPGVGEACERLRADGFELVVVTNQPDVARGALDARALDEVHRRLREAVAVDEIVFCPHDDTDACECRKPLPGMIVAAAERRGIDLARSYLVGDRWKDVEAGRAAGCRTVLVGPGYDERAAEGFDAAVADLPAAADWILSR